MAEGIIAENQTTKKNLEAIRGKFNRLLASKKASVNKAEKLLGEVRLLYNDPDMKDKAVVLAGEIDSFKRMNKPGPETIVIC